MIGQRDARDETHELMEAVRSPAGDSQRKIEFRMSGFDEHVETMIRSLDGGEAN